MLGNEKVNCVIALQVCIVCVHMYTKDSCVRVNFCVCLYMCVCVCVCMYVCEKVDYVITLQVCLVIPYICVYVCVCVRAREILCGCAGVCEEVVCISDL